MQVHWYVHTPFLNYKLLQLHITWQEHYTYEEDVTWMDCLKFMFLLYRNEIGDLVNNVNISDFL